MLTPSTTALHLSAGSADPLSSGMPQMALTDSTLPIAGSALYGTHLFDNTSHNISSYTTAPCPGCHPQISNSCRHKDSHPAALDGPPWFTHRKSTIPWLAPHRKPTMRDLQRCHDLAKGKAFLVVVLVALENNPPMRGPRPYTVRGEERQHRW